MENCLDDNITITSSNDSLSMDSSNHRDRFDSSAGSVDNSLFENSYDIGREIGRGNAVVYEGTNKKTGRKVAIKKIEGGFATPALRKSTIREIQNQIGRAHV